MATAAPEAAHTAYGVLGGPAGARCRGTVSVERLPASPSWRRSQRGVARHQQNIFCGTAFKPHDQIGVRGQRVVQSVEDRRQHHHVHVTQLDQGWVGTDRYAARIRSHHHRTESPPGPRPPGTRRRAAPYRWRPGARRRRQRPCIRPEPRWRARAPRLHRGTIRRRVEPDRPTFAVWLTSRSGVPRARCRNRAARRAEVHGAHRLVAEPQVESGPGGEERNEPFRTGLLGVDEWTQVRLVGVERPPRPLRGPVDAGERLVRGHRVIGLPGYTLDETWLRQIGELMYARGGFDLGAHARAGATILASGDRRAALAGLHIPTLVLHGQADQLMRPEGGCPSPPPYRTPLLSCCPTWATICHKPCGPPSSTTSDPPPTDLAPQQANEGASARGVIRGATSHGATLSTTQRPRQSMRVRRQLAFNYVTEP
jgi:hypothetical protein